MLCRITTETPTLGWIVAVTDKNQALFRIEWRGLTADGQINGGRVLYPNRDLPYPRRCRPAADVESVLDEVLARPDLRAYLNKGKTLEFVLSEE